MLFCGQLLSAEVVTRDYDGGFEDAEVSLQSAIEAQGLKVDHVSNVGDMLERTAESVGAETLTYHNARIFQFCSATLSRKMMEINPENLGFCPYQIFVYQTADSDHAVIGYRSFPEGEMKEVESLIDQIIEDAIAF